MTPAKQAKEMGLDGVKELVELGGFPASSLHDMSVKHPKRFQTVLYGCLYKKQQAESEHEQDRGSNKTK